MLIRVDNKDPDEPMLPILNEDQDVLLDHPLREWFINATSSDGDLPFPSPLLNSEFLTLRRFFRHDPISPRSERTLASRTRHSVARLFFKDQFLDPPRESKHVDQSRPQDHDPSRTWR